ncbi:hypothetical protein SSBR45G_30890 [Bradyrhizobium sp. SSBR45G]|uniref:hypothetical protein n=1 Tax=unclassified Bradyrhizobium TaxID=2631580 RepID=UPI002342A7B9|nr:MULTISPECIES: hypothetical protein [unclassified Bradyrhizobium]GLH78180.1 hypothetical protein SSBR45G_30890 [Bradyrhizobium sp. SSBR45G]GLH86053.1 hypothetical protein SSBR45R_35130 [Bradyrhizobium sp. SSBR45R]
MAVKATDIQPGDVDATQSNVRVLDLPRNNPCAQCAEPIALPSWVEKDGRRTAYLWHCRLCDYRYETIAFYAEAVDEAGALAA